MPPTPKKTPVLVPGTWGPYRIWQQERSFVDLIKVRILR